MRSRPHVELFPKLASAHAALARGYELSGNRPAALGEARAAFVLDPNSARAHELVRALGGTTAVKRGG